MSKTVKRFLKYTAVGFSTFLLDLALLLLFTDLFHFHYLYSAGFAYLIAVSLNYYLSRRFVFPQTEQSIKQSYLPFILIAGVGLAVIVVLLAIMVETLQWNYLVSRVISAGMVGMGNYLLNLYVNFKVVGIH